MTDHECVDYLENICKMFVNGSKNCEGQALEYHQKYISAIRHVIAKLQNGIPYEERQKGEWIDYNNTFYKCPECGYLLEKCCPQCQNKVILPKGGEDMRKPNCVTCDHFGDCDGCERREEE